MNPILQHHEIPADLEERALQLARRHALAFGGSVNVPLIDNTVTSLARQLGEPGGNAAAQLILSSLVPEVERNGTDFWATPLGRACGWWTGAGTLSPTDGPDLEVSTPNLRVAVLLGITRQGAHKLMTTGTLRRNSLVGVRPEDVRREMQARWPL